MHANQHHKVEQTLPETPPEMSEAVRVILEQMNAAVPDPDDFDVDAFRAAARAWPVPDPTIQLAAVDDERIDGPGGPLAVRLYRPTLDRGSPVIVYAHGGGFILGDLDSHDGICRRLAAGTNSTVCAVDYRLAPEHPFPAAVDDVYAVVDRDDSTPARPSAGRRSDRP